MTGQLAPPPVFKAFDNNGNPLAGGQLFTYAAGTTSPQATYTDSTLGTPNTNPVVLNARGEANVWFDPTLTYKVQLQDSVGNSIYTVDNILGGLSQQSVGQAIYPLSNGEIVGGITPAKYYYPPGNVLRYGADPSGGQSSVPAFNSAYTQAMAVTPHTPIYIPAGTYLIPNPGLTFTNQNDIRIYGDGPNQSVLRGDSSNSYTILTCSADTGHGTTGLNLNLSNFGIINGTGGQQYAMKLADYLYGKIENLLLQSSGNALTMNGMASITLHNINALTWMTNGAGNTALALALDTANVPNGPLFFSGCQFEGSGNVTSAGAVQSNQTIGTTFADCIFIAIGPAVISAFEATNLDDITLINPYSESTCNTTNNNAVIFLLGRVAAPLNFVIIGGHIFQGNGVNFCKYGVTGNNIANFTAINTVWANFTTAALNLALTAGANIITLSQVAQGGAATVFQSGIGAPTGGSVAYWVYPGLNTTGNTHTVAAGSTTNVFTNTTFDGSNGSQAYTVGDIVANLKAAGILKP